MLGRLDEAIEHLQEVMDEEGIDPRKGLPQELFLFATTLLPCPNIDLFITDNKHRLLLTWREDEFYGKGWHIPGGCLRLKETLDNRIQHTALNEIGTKVIYDTDNFVTREGMVKHPRPWLRNDLQRSHNISMLFFCTLPDGFDPITNVNNSPARGDLRWFDAFPDNLLGAHKDLYGDIIENYFKEPTI